MYKKQEHSDDKFVKSFFSDIGLKINYNPDIPLLIAVAHQDDETIGAFSIMHNFTNVKLLHITDGAPKNMIDARREGFETREDYALQRKSEVYDVLSYLGIHESGCFEIGVSDQEASYHLDFLTFRLKEIIIYLKPQLVLTHSYEGGHPDHDATAFAVHAACRLLKQENNTFPVIIEFALYNNYPGYFTMNKFIPHKNLREKLVELNKYEIELKKDLLDIFTTQKYLINNYTNTFESYRISPEYDFSKPSHEGIVNYDKFDWGIKSKEWCEIAYNSMEMLNIRGKI